MGDPSTETRARSETVVEVERVPVARGLSERFDYVVACDEHLLMAVAGGEFHALAGTVGEGMPGRIRSPRLLVEIDDLRRGR